MAERITTQSFPLVPTKRSRPLRTVALISPDDDFSDDLMGLPIGVRWRRFKGYEKTLISSVIASEPDAIVVVSNGNSMVSYQRVCEVIRHKINVPLLFINRGRYPEQYDFSSFADVDVGEPKNRRDLLNLGIEIIRLAYGVPTPGVKVGMASAFKRRTARWILTVGAFIAILSGGMTALIQGEIEIAIQTAVTTFSAITSVEVGTLVGHYLRQRAR